MTESPGRILDAAAVILRSGGPDAVTIDAVIQRADVARATLYRHFPSRDQLLAATFQHLLPAPATPPVDGSVRERLISVVLDQAQSLSETPMLMVAMAWLALGRETESGGTVDSSKLLQNIVVQHMAPFEAILDDPSTVAELGIVDHTTVLCLLIGPIVFARIADLTDFDYRQCGITSVDAYLAANRRRPPR